jgi:hypothetical protein
VVGIDLRGPSTGLRSDDGYKKGNWVTFCLEFRVREMRPLLLLDAEAALDSRVSVGVRCAGLTRDAAAARAVRAGDFQLARRRAERKDARKDGRRRRGCNKCGSRGDGR